MTIVEQHVVETERKLARLESQIEKDRHLDQENEQGLRDRFAQMRVILDSLSNDMQALNGRLDEIDFLMEKKISTQDRKRDKLSESVNLNSSRIIRLEEYLNFEPADRKKAADTEDVPDNQTVKRISEAQLYVLAKQAFDQEDLEGAREGFEKLLQRYPKSENADNSQFWIGEIYYREKWYEKAILEYQKVIETYPTGNKVQSALLKQGLAFLNLGDKANARLILNELVNKYPKSSEAGIARTKLKEF